MKSQLEEISKLADSSFRIMVNPNLSDFFFWHFHPELELVYIEGAHGTRHVGDHISGFRDSDLVFIGSNIPHLNFDYGIKTPYQKIVVHMRADFLELALQATPELKLIKRLFSRSAHGVAFGKKVQSTLAGPLKRLPTLSPFNQFLEMLRIFHMLALDDEMTLLHPGPVQNPNSLREKRRIKAIYKFIENNYQRKIDLQEAAELSSLSKEAFCRYFKKMTKLTFTEFVNHYRIDIAKKLLLQHSSITDTCFDCGFESISYFNRVFKKVTGTNPLAFKKMYTLNDQDQTIIM